MSQEKQRLAVVIYVSDNKFDFLYVINKSLEAFYRNLGERAKYITYRDLDIKVVNINEDEDGLSYDIQASIEI